MTEDRTPTPPIDLSIGADLDRWGHANGARQRYCREPDANYRKVILAARGQWVLIHPDFGQSIDSERWAVQQNELAAAERKRRFNAVARLAGEPELP